MDTTAMDKIIKECEEMANRPIGRKSAKMQEYDNQLANLTLGFNKVTSELNRMLIKR